MPESAAHTFFAIPELVLLLAKNVDVPDLLQCSLVCKDWSRQFQPILWTEFDFNIETIKLLNTDPSPTREALTKNLGHIRKLDFTCVDHLQLQLLIQGLPDQLGDTIKESGTLCTNLTEIEVFELDMDHSDLISRPLVTLLDHNPRLTCLDVSCDIFTIDGVPAAVSKLWQLQHLIIRSLSTLPGVQNPLEILQSCLALPELIELYFDMVEMRWDYGDETTVRRELEAVINEATIARFTRNSDAEKINLLTLPCNIAGRWNPLPLLLLKSNLLDLERCEIPWFGPAYQHNDDRNGQATRAFIRGCSGLQSFYAMHFHDGLDSEPMLIISELVSRHHSTLEVFRITSAEHVYSHDLQEVLSRCRELEQFWASGKDHASMCSIAFRDISKSDWVCTELKELHITLNRCRRERDTSGDLGEEEKQDDPYVWLTANTTKRAYQQIGRLEKLETLVIDIDRSYRSRATENDYRWDLTLWKGWLGEWAGLKNLKSLELKADFWSNMRQFEVEFMHEHWLLLNELSFSCDVSQLHTEPHWQWLLEKRPQLRLVRAY
ncbi:hypothetical protein BGZ72_000993 [Mortierella alpina]|nr:hypothetical protein BGZ72_000993 [Mortierella alpina]